MRYLVLATAATALFATSVSVFAQDNKSKATTKPGSQPSAKPAAAANATAGAAPAAPATNPVDEKEIRQSGEAYVKAFNQKDAKAIAELYTADAEYIDEHGAGILGRSAIEESMKSFFTKNPDVRLQLSIGSVRFIAPNVAIEDGVTTVTVSKEAIPVTTRYTAVHSKTSGKWQVASVRDASAPQPNEHRNRMKQFEWMIGEWVHEGSDAKIVFNCKTADNGNFLVRDFSVQVGGNERISGTQRIGWDAQAGKYKSWIFDSDGGASEGYWHRDGDSWVLKSIGVTAGGQSASSTSIYTIENAHTMTFQSMDHEVAGTELPDGLKVKIVRRPPKPE